MTPQYLSGLLAQFPYVGIVGLIVLGGIGLPFPEDATLILAGFLIANGVLEPAPALAALFVSVLVTDYMIYKVGKKYGRMVVTHKRFHKILSPERLSKLEETLNRRGGLLIIFGRHILGLRAQIFLVSGIIRMPTAKFLALDAITAIVTIAIMAGAGYAGGSSFEAVRNDMKRIEHLAVFVLLTALAVFLTVRFFKLRNK